MGDPFEAHDNNHSVFDNYIHEPCYLIGVIAGSMTSSNRTDMVDGYPTGEVTRLFQAFMPYQFFLMLLYVLSIVAMIIVARRADYPTALLKPYRRGEKL